MNALGTGPQPPPVPPSVVRRWRRRLADEHLEAAVYRGLAARRAGEERAILLALADAEARHAAHWEALLGEHVGRGRASLRARVLAFLAKRFGSVFILALAQRAEGRSPYEGDLDATRAMAADERVHEEVVRGLAARGREQVSGTFRAAVFGANDGLVSNLALVVGVSGGGAATTTVLLTGLAGLLAGALSMGAGEFISVRSQRELLAASSPGTGARAALPYLDVDANELALVYRARGLTAEQAQAKADRALAAWPGEQEPGEQEPGEQETSEQDPGEAHGHDVVGSDVGAALSSSGFFASGALVPVLPFLLGLTGTAALVAAAVLVAGALLVTGAAVGLLSGGPPLRRGVRQLAIGFGAATVTYLLGALFGATVG